MQIMYNKKHLTILLIDGAHGHTDKQIPKEMDPVGSLLKVSSSRKGELETRASLDLPASCGP